MTTERLQHLLRQMGAVVVGGEIVAPCPLCQPGETDWQRLKLKLTPGQKQPLVGYCFRCCVPKDRDHNRSWWRAVTDELPQLKEILATDEITARRLWASVQCRPAEGGAAVAPVAVLDSVYGWLLHRLPLGDRHRRWLQKRGLDPNWAFQAGYRSSPTAEEAAALAEAAGREWGSALDGVPGFYRGDGRLRLATRTDAVQTPCRDPSGRVQALKQRLLDGRKGRLRLLSSAFAGGPKAVNGCHYPLGSGGQQRQRLVVCEGERKSDVLWQQLQWPSVAIPGTGAWQLAVAAIRQWVPPGGEVALALDRDEAGDRASGLIMRALPEYTLLAVKWHQRKGIDDALVAGQSLEVVVVREPLGGQTPTPCEKKPAATAGLHGRSTADEVLRWLAQRGPVLREAVPTHPSTVTALVRSGRVAVTYSPRGQVLEVPRD